MGLDMYAMITKEQMKREVDCTPSQVDDLYSWRKHPSLHGWMADLYYVKGGTQWMFNGATVALNAQDLSVLEAFIKANALPETVGLGFGTSDETMIDGDLEFVALARNALSEGYSVLYTSSW